MSLITINVSSNEKLDEISNQLTLLTNRINIMSATQDQLAADLQALAAQRSA